MGAIDLTLPEWAFLETQSHEGNPLGDRTVILHVRSASVIEILDRDKSRLKDNTVSYSFGNKRTGEKLIAVLHYSATMEDYRQLKELLKKCAIWYVDYSDWEDQDSMK